MVLDLPAISLRLAMLVSLTGPSAPFDTYPKNPGIDALNYAFRIELSDTTDAIVGEMTLDVRFLAPNVRSLRLDLANAAEEPGGKGMHVSSVTMDSAAVPYTHVDDALQIQLPSPPAVEQRSRVIVRYSGTPASGLAIKKNRYGDRTFFSDNWPNKARQWLPTIDHPYDKATSEFIVTAPSHYQVVSNGLRVEVTDLTGERRRTHWRNSVPIAPWLFTLGVARFAVQRVDAFEGKPIETWVYAQDRDAGFADFATPTRSVLAFFSDYVGPFAYEKLANVQSSTVSGGMEAASAIMYGENSVTDTPSVRWRNVVIHEIAHQWFGNAVTEADWDDVWLSEGFATYFTQLYIEHAYGRDEFVRGMLSSRQTVATFAATHPDYTIVHRNLSRMEDVTSSHTYQKGSWTLHMLRGVIGDEAFQRGIRSYYRQHFNANATTADFRRAMEDASGRDLGWFFDEWLYKPGTLKVAGGWTYDARAKQVRITLDQVQTDGSVFRMPVEVAVYASKEAAPTIHRVEMIAKANAFRIDVPSEPDDVRLDPNLWVLMDATFERAR